MPHYLVIDPDREWHRDLRIYWKRIAAIIVGVLADCGVSIALWVFGHWQIGLGALIAGVAVGGSLLAWAFTLQTVRVRRIRSDEKMHLFFHHLRDRSASILNCAECGTCKGLLEEFHKDVVRDVADFFRARKGDNSYDSAIRLAAKMDDRDVYITRARSAGLSANRETKSMPIPADEGLAKVLRDQRCQGVYIVPDLDQAVKEHLWYYTPNDSLDDIKTVMVAPINAFEGSEKSMVGLLYVTYPKSGQKVFQPADTVPLKTFADFLGLAYPAVMTKMETLATTQGSTNG